MRNSLDVPPLDILLEYWTAHVTFGFLYVILTFPTRIFYRGVPGFATDCHCGVWCRGLTICLLYVGPLFGNLLKSDSRFIKLTGKQPFCCFLLFRISVTFSQCLHWPVCTLAGPVFTRLPLECHWLTQYTLGYSWGQHGAYLGPVR